MLPTTSQLSPFAGSVKTLHLFEARYLSLLDTVLAQPGSNKVFGHVVVEQQGDAFGDTAAAFPGAYRGDGFVFLMATLVRVSLDSCCTAALGIASCRPPSCHVASCDKQHAVTGSSHRYSSAGNPDFWVLQC